MDIPLFITALIGFFESIAPARLQSGAAMTTADWALIISLVSAMMAVASFVWNVWSKFIYPKATVRVAISVVSFIPDDQGIGQFITVRATNYGPGPVTLHTLMTRQRAAGLRRQWRYGVLNPLHNFPAEAETSIGPFGGGLPKRIEFGEDFEVYLTIRHEALRDEPIVDIGFHDIFGRHHWAPRKQVSKVRQGVAKSYPAQS